MGRASVVVLEIGLEPIFLGSWSCLGLEGFFTWSCLGLGRAGLGFSEQDQSRPSLFVHALVIRVKKDPLKNS